jgi:hypothetical protein
MRRPIPGGRSRTKAALGVAVLAVIGVVMPASAAHASESVVWGPGCSNDNTVFTEAPVELDYGPTGGTWTGYSGLDANGNKPDFSGTGSLGSCSGSIEYAWNGASDTFQWLIPNSAAYLPAGSSCTIDAYIPTIDAGVYAARYDFWWADASGNWHWLAWPGHDVDQQALSGWNQIMYAFTMPAAAEFKITLKDDTANDSASRYLGAGDMELNCG